MKRGSLRRPLAVGVFALSQALAGAQARAESSTVQITSEPKADAASDSKLEAQAMPEADKSDDARAIKPSIDNKSDVMAGLRGGTSQKPTFLGALTVGVDFNFEKLWAGAKGWTATVQGLGLYGQSPSTRIGDYQGADQIAANPGAELYQAWLQKSLFDDHLALLAGLHDLNNEFYTTDSSANFMNTSFVIGPEIVHSGRQGPSVWPATSLGARARVQVSDGLQLSVAAYDGIPGDPAAPGHSGLGFRPGDGVMVIAEADYLPKINGLAGKYGLGGWGYDRTQDDLSETDDQGVPLTAKSRGIYALLDQRVYAPTGSSGSDGPGLNAFLRLGWADASADPIEYAGQAGVLYTGLWAAREKDQLGLGTAIARAGANYRQSVLVKGNEIALYEGAFELLYRVHVANWLWVSPDFQWIVAPSMNPNVANAVVGSSRVELMF